MCLAWTALLKILKPRFLAWKCHVAVSFKPYLLHVLLALQFSVSLHSLLLISLDAWLCKAFWCCIS